MSLLTFFLLFPHGTYIATGPKETQNFFHWSGCLYVCTVPCLVYYNQNKFLYIFMWFFSYTYRNTSKEKSCVVGLYSTISLTHKLTTKLCEKCCLGCYHFRARTLDEKTSQTLIKAQLCKMMSDLYLTQHDRRWMDSEKRWKRYKKVWKIIWTHKSERIKKRDSKIKNKRELNFSVYKKKRTDTLEK